MAGRRNTRLICVRRWRGRNEKLVTMRALDSLSDIFVWDGCFAAARWTHVKPASHLRHSGRSRLESPLDFHEASQSTAIQSCVLESQRDSNPSAQGCEERATLGYVPQNVFNAEGVASLPPPHTQCARGLAHSKTLRAGRAGSPLPAASANRHIQPPRRRARSDAPYLPRQ